MKSDTAAKIQSFLEKEGITLNVLNFVKETSNIYHKYESLTYDRRQTSILNSSVHWQKALSKASGYLPKELKVLDFGCGTGYAISQLLRSPLAKNIKHVTCYDLSSEMVEIAKKNLSEFNIEIEFLTDIQGHKLLNSKENHFNLVLTNAVLHHLIDLNSFFCFLDKILMNGGIYIAGHEPHKKFYENQFLTNTTKLFQKYKRIKQRLSTSYWLNKLGINKITKEDISSLTLKELISRNLVNEKFPRAMIPKLVDIHVPIGLSKAQPWGELGFDEDLILNSYLKDLSYKFIFKQTYSHIKDSNAEKDMLWSRAIKFLAKKYPLDGADCLIIFQKNGQ